jgi:preprotein translocase subunit YajC
MSFLISDAHAQAATAAPQQSPYSFFLMIRPQQKRAKEHQNLLSKLAAGDEVVSTAGILGRIVEVGDAFITLEVADGVRIKLQKSQVTQLVPKGTYKSA